MAPFLPVAIFLISVAGFGMALRYRFGPRTAASERYFATLRGPNSPHVVGNLHIALLPASIGGLAMALAMPVGGLLGIVGIACWLALSLVGLAFALRPPGWAKARWLADAEDRGEWPVADVGGFDIAVTIFLLAALGGPLVVICVVLASRALSN